MTKITTDTIDIINGNGCDGSSTGSTAVKTKQKKGVNKNRIFIVANSSPTFELWWFSRCGLKSKILIAHIPLTTTKHVVFFHW